MSAGKWCEGSCEKYLPFRDFEFSQTEGLCWLCDAKTRIVVKTTITKKRRPKNSDTKDVKDRFGLTEKDRFEMAKAQEFKCGICKKKKRLVVDHCHESEEEGVMFVRGMLCNNCNPMLGFSKDSPEVLRNGADYVEKANLKKLSQKQLL